MNSERRQYAVLMIILILVGLLIYFTWLPIIPNDLCIRFLIEMVLYLAVRILIPKGVRFLPLFVLLTLVTARFIYCVYDISRSKYFAMTIENLLRRYNGEIFVCYIFGFSILVGYEMVLSSWRKKESKKKDEEDAISGEEAEKDIEKRRAMGCLKGCLTTIIINIVAVAAVVIGVKVLDSIPKTVDEQKYGEYTVELCAIGSPEWPFGSQDGVVILSKGSEICSVDFSLHNDGKNMNNGNWRVSWENDKVVVTIMGEEQPDEIITLYFDGRSDTGR